MNEERRTAIVTLLTTRDDGLPESVARPDSAPGFVNEARPRTCPDCLANGAAMADCETCGGRGVVVPADLGRLAIVDELPDDGQTRDPYAKNEQVLPFGFDVTRHDAARERDTQIEALRQQTRPAPDEAKLLEEANRRGYAWEEARRTMYQRYDYRALDLELDRLRDTDEHAYRALHAVYVYRWLRELSPGVEIALERGLLVLSARLPDPLRAPGVHPAAIRIARRHQRQQQAS